MGPIGNIFLMPSEAAGLYDRAGRPAPVSLATGFWVLLPLVGGIVWLFKAQGALNAYWASTSETPAAST